MSRWISLPLALPVLIATGLLPVAVRGQSSDSQAQSVADAARRAREQKKASTKPATVVTDETIKPAAKDAAPATPDSAVPAQPADAVSPSDPETAKATDEKTKAATEELTRLKQELAEAEKGLDVLKRDESLQEDTYLSNPDHVRDTAGKAKLDAMKQQIADKALDVAALKERVAALEAAAGPKPATPPPPQS
jgi:hypothetical protein